jgi:hypothetical protein
MRSIDIVNHQIERRSGSALGWLLGLSEMIYVPPRSSSTASSPKAAIERKPTVSGQRVAAVPFALAHEEDLQ